MRFIEWDDEIATRTFNNYREHFKDFHNHRNNQLWGNVAEVLVQNHYNQPFNNTIKDKPDGGWDMEIEGIKIDIKSQVNELCWFNAPTSNFSVACYKPLVADYYLFCQIDPDTKSIAIVGYLTKDEIKLLGRFYRKGDYVNQKFIADCDLYCIQLADMHPVNP